MYSMAYPPRCAAALSDRMAHDRRHERALRNLLRPRCRHRPCKACQSLAGARCVQQHAGGTGCPGRIFAIRDGRIDRRCPPLRVSRHDCRPVQAGARVQARQPCCRRSTQFTAARTPFEIAHLVLGRLGPYFALVPGAAPQALGRLESDCVERFQMFKAPLTVDDSRPSQTAIADAGAKTKPGALGLSLCAREFRFHMTLTNAVPQDQRDAVQPRLKRISRQSSESRC